MLLKTTKGKERDSQTPRKKGQKIVEAVILARKLPQSDLACRLVPEPLDVVSLRSDKPIWEGLEV